MGTPFDEATTVRAVGDGRYASSLDDSWNLLPFPQGGVVTAVAVRAMAAELDDPSQALRTLHTTYVAPVADGELAIDVEVLRRGRSMSHLRAEVRNAGNAHGHVTTAVFGRPRDGFEFTDLAPPADVPRPSDCGSFRDPAPEGARTFTTTRFWGERLDGRPAIGHAPWDVYEPTTSARAFWISFDEPPVRADGTLDPLALLVMSDTMPGAVHERLGPQERMWFGPSVDLTFHLLAGLRPGWVLAENRARHAGDGYASVDNALWDHGPDGTSTPRLVAYATQVMFFTFQDDLGPV